MGIYIGGYHPGFAFAVEAPNAVPRTLINEAINISSGQYFDAMRTIVIDSGSITGSQYYVNIVPERYPLFGSIPSLTYSSDNEDIGTVDSSGYTAFVTTGTFNVTVSIPVNDYYAGYDVHVPITNISGGGVVIATTGYGVDPVDVSKHVLIVYNSGSQQSIDIKDYYTGHRPLFSNANVLGIAPPTGELISFASYTGLIKKPIIDFLTGFSGTKPIKYIVMMRHIPSCVNHISYYNVGYLISNAMMSGGFTSGDEYWYQNTHFSTAQYPGSAPLVTYLAFNSSGDDIAYIDKISAGQTGVYLTGNGLNTGYYFDDYQAMYGHYYPTFMSGRYLQPIQQYYPNVPYEWQPWSGVGAHGIATGNDVAGYASWSVNGYQPANFALNGSVKWGRNRSNRYVMTTIESFNGNAGMSFGHSNFSRWFSSGAFGGTGWENCPVGASCTLHEPGLWGTCYTGFFALWERGWPLIEAVWQSRRWHNTISFGDPLVCK